MEIIDTPAYPTDSLVTKVEAAVFLKKLAQARATNVNPNRFTVPGHDLEGDFVPGDSVLRLQYIRCGAVYSLSILVPKNLVPRLYGTEVPIALARMFFARCCAVRSFRFSVIVEEVSTRVHAAYRGDDEELAGKVFADAVGASGVLSATLRDRETGLVKFWDQVAGTRSVSAPVLPVIQTA